MRFWILPLLAFKLAAQTPLFEVASIRPANPPFTLPPLCGGLIESPDNIVSQESVLASGVYILEQLLTEAYRDEADDFNFDSPGWLKITAFLPSA